MSIEATIWAWKQKCKATDMLVLLRMANFANEDNQAYPSIKRLHEDTHADRKTIIRSLDRLESAGLISDTGNRVGRTGKVKVYQLNLETVPKAASLNDTQNGTIKEIPMVPKAEPLEGETVPKEGSLTGVMVPVFPCNSPKSGTQNYKYNHKQINNIINKLDFTSWPNLPDQQILDDWFAMRKRKKANVSQTVVNQFGKKLHQAITIGWTVDDVIALCVERNWQGFELDWLPAKSNGNEKTQSDRQRNNGRVHPLERMQRNNEERKAASGRIYDGSLVGEAV